MLLAIPPGFCAIHIVMVNRPELNGIFTGLRRSISQLNLKLSATSNRLVDRN